MPASRPAVTTQSPEETRQFGRQLATELSGGDCVALYGDLGSGKTCLVQGICAGLDVAERVTSPTFILVNEFDGVAGDGEPLKIHHFDLYRLAGPDELVEIGWDDYLSGGGLCLVEWADRATELLPPHTCSIHIEAPEEHVRVFRFT